MWVSKVVRGGQGGSLEGDSPHSSLTLRPSMGRPAQTWFMSFMSVGTQSAKTLRSSRSGALTAIGDALAMAVFLGEDDDLAVLLPQVVGVLRDVEDEGVKADLVVAEGLAVRGVQVARLADVVFGVTVVVRVASALRLVDSTTVRNEGRR